jgi:predicted ester cyclase
VFYFTIQGRIQMKRLLFVPTLCLFLASVAGISGCAKSSTGGAIDTTKSATDDVAANKAAAQKIYDMFNAKNFDGLGQVITTDAVDHNPDPGQGPGLAGMVVALKGLAVGFSDVKFTIVNIVAEGDLVAANLRITGTNDGPMMGGMAPTHKKFDISGMDMMRFKSGKAIERWGNFDGPKMMQQLGLDSPPPGGAPGATKAPAKK